MNNLNTARTYRPTSTSDNILDVSDVISLEHHIAAEGTPLLTLMQRAGFALAQLVTSKEPRPCPVLILCGSGNNAGDGWVAALHLAKAGYAVEVLCTRAPEAYTQEPARSAIVQLQEDPAFAQVNVHICHDAKDTALLQELGKGCIIVDCILGTGFDGGTVKEPYHTWIQEANTTEALRIACDIPSGMNGQTGHVGDVAFQADATLTMLAAKRGLTETKEPCVGELFLAPLAIGEN